MTRLRRILNALTHTGPGPGYDPWARAHGEEIADIKTAHEAHRAALSEALGLGTSAPWEAITKHAQQASKRVRELRAESLRRGKEVVARNDRIMALERRAEEAEAEVKRLGLMVDDYAAGARQLSEKLRAERDVAYQRLTRARRAEATLTRVRDAVAAARACGTEDGLCPVCADGGGHHAAIERALDDDQPTPDEPEVQHCCVCGSTHVAYRNYADMPFCGPCAGCGCGETPCTRTGINDPTTSAEPQRDQSPTVHVHLDNRGAVYHPWPPEMRAEPEPEQPADSEDEPELIPVLDYAVRRLATAIRNALKEHS